MAEPNSNHLTVPTPFGSITAKGSMVTIGLLIVVLLGFVYLEMDKVSDEFESIRVRIDERFKQIDDAQKYNSCLSRLTLWRAVRPREESINLDILPTEFYYCLPAYLVKKNS